jgi:hypothetical protein
MGNLHNIWEGKRLEIVGNNHYFNLVEKDRRFCCMEDGSINYNPSALMMTEEEEEEFNKDMIEFNREVIFGNNKKKR